MDGTHQSLGLRKKGGGDLAIPIRAGIVRPEIASAPTSMLVINLWGAPGAGKSTVAAGLFFLMKINQWKVELVTEFAKELVWDQRESFFGDQVGIFAEQNHRLLRLADHRIDCAITDSPLPLPVFYKEDGYLSGFESLVFEQFHRYDNVNFLLQRKHTFEAVGRRHNETESNEIEQRLEQFIEQHRIEHTRVEANRRTPQVIFRQIKNRLIPTG